MKTFRISVGIPALLVLMFFTAAIFSPPFMCDQDTLLELLFILIGIPILTLNIWAWMEPELVEVSFLGKVKEKIVSLV